jgi:uncharacterized peroxidase-related enzyme
VKHNWRRAKLSPATRALLAFAEKLTRSPGRMSRDDLESLRARGFDDRAILDAVEVVAYFNYINRIADALGVDPEPEMREAKERWDRRGA